MSMVKKNGTMQIAIQAIEYYLPPNSEDGSVLVRDNPDWRMADIERKTGVHTRHVSAPTQTAVDMAALAIEKLFATGIGREEIDFLILVTQSPDYLIPTSACILQDRLGLPKSCMAFDVNLGCSGFVYGLTIGGSLIQAGVAAKGILVCSDTYTKYIAASDRTCRPLFSDAAAATLIGSNATSTMGPFEMGTDGSGFRDLMIPTGGARTSSDNRTLPCHLSMNGSKVFMFTMDMVPKCVMSLLEKSKKMLKDIDLFVFHQASKLVMDNIIRRLELPEEKVFSNLDRVGNTVSASIPIALKDAVEAGRLQEGDQVMLLGFGVGYSWGGCLMQWGTMI